jgi:hypothetical protein
VRGRICDDQNASSDPSAPPSAARTAGLGEQLLHDAPRLHPEKPHGDLCVSTCRACNRRLATFAHAISKVMTEGINTTAPIVSTAVYALRATT